MAVMWKGGVRWKWFWFSFGFGFGFGFIGRGFVFVLWSAVSYVVSFGLVWFGLEVAGDVFGVDAFATFAKSF